MKKYKNSGECAGGLFFWAADMVIVNQLSERIICATIDRLLDDGEFVSVFSKNQKAKDITSNEDGDSLQLFNQLL